MLVQANYTLQKILHIFLFEVLAGSHMHISFGAFLPVSVRSKLSFFSGESRRNVLHYCYNILYGKSGGHVCSYISAYG